MIPALMNAAIRHGIRAGVAPTRLLNRDEEGRNALPQFGARGRQFSV